MNDGYVPTPLASSARARLSFGMGDGPDSMVAKTVLNDPQKNNGESVDNGKVPSSPAGSPEPQMSHRALQDGKPSTLESMEWNPDMEEWSTQDASDWLEKSTL